MQTLSSTTSINVMTTRLCQERVVASMPYAYRLVHKKAEGVLVLQGAYSWTEGLTNSGYIWQDIPTVEL